MVKNSQTVRNIVKQGTIFGPILCCSSTGRIDEMGKGNTESVVSPKMNIGTLIYVDDIGAAGSKTRIEEVGEN